MISPTPWRISTSNPSVIYDADDEIVAENYTFAHVDDFESLCKLVNLGAEELQESIKDLTRRVAKLERHHAKF